MRRLYSTFAIGWPGIGLLVMRLVVGSVLIAGLRSRVWSDRPLHMTLTAAPLALLALLVVAGLWTPVAGVLIAAIEIMQIVRGTDHTVVNLLTGTIAAALAMLGPGRWSIDARLFGWKRIEASPRRNGSSLG